MSRNQEKITKALNKKGYQPIDIDWTPIAGSPIMCGPDGGWYIDFEPLEGKNPPNGLMNYNIMGYNINEVMEQIESLQECI
ncbi:hypothetical protein D3C76_1707890 [compost metagenome]